MGHSHLLSHQLSYGAALAHDHKGRQIIEDQLEVFPPITDYDSLCSILEKKWWRENKISI